MKDPSGERAYIRDKAEIRYVDESKERIIPKNTATEKGSVLNLYKIFIISVKFYIFSVKFYVRTRKHTTALLDHRQRVTKALQGMHTRRPCKC